MKSNTKKLIGIGLSALALTGVATAAMGGFSDNGENGILRNNANLEIALDNGDYDAFVSTLAEINPNAADHMTEDRFFDIVERQQIKDESEIAIENNDYEAWVNAVSSSQFGENIREIVSEEDFQIIREIHEAREDGDNTRARELSQEIDWKPSFGIQAGYGQGNGMGQGSLNEHRTMEQGRGQGMNGQGSQGRTRMNSGDCTGTGYMGGQ